LRQDNADFRLTPMGYEIGLASEKAFEEWSTKKKESEKMVFKDTSVSVAEANPILESRVRLISQGDKMFKVFPRPQIDLEDILKFDKVQAYVAENNLDQKFRKQKFK
jgi:tRNA uridine 5-carboxymethylaminomethyl modification enzyme